MGIDSINPVDSDAGRKPPRFAPTLKLGPHVGPVSRASLSLFSVYLELPQVPKVA